MESRLKEILKKSKENILIETEFGKVAIDRSVGVVLLVLWESSDGVNFVICKRGYKTSEEKAKWNLPSGYLNWNESGEEAAARELWEECGIEVDPNKIFELEHSTSPEENKQNIIFRYGIELPGPPKFAGPIDESEILQVRFSNLKEIEEEELNFAWKQKETIKRLIEKWKQRK